MNTAMTKTQIPPLSLWIKTDSLEIKFLRGPFTGSLLVGTDMAEIWYIVYWYTGTGMVQIVWV